jgi:hypothetical protein
VLMTKRHAECAFIPQASVKRLHVGPDLNDAPKEPPSQLCAAAVLCNIGALVLKLRLLRGCPIQQSDLVPLALISAGRA